ncbi:hypothetical protein QBC44DRAFT_12294 [Cladorrhinum sp. PSN332]|nr:hypothetical protein QBC44DRAFT_12294 [Cladorrhinum sp. PSN332]
MPRRDFPSRQEDPYRRINNWDDGHDNGNSSPPRYAREDDYRPRHRDYSPQPRRHHRSPSPVPHYYHNDNNNNNNNAAGRPPLTRSKSTSAKALAKEGLATLQHLSPQWQKAAKAALQAGGMAALAQRKKSGAWAGAKGARVATAAIGAAAADVMANRAKEKVRDHRDNRDHRDRDRSRDRDRDRDYDRRDRDRSRGGDRGYDRRDRGRDRDTSRDRDYDRSPREKSKKRGEPINMIGDMLGGFIMEHISKRGNSARH